MPFKKGYTPWNTGLTKADPRIRDMTDKAQATMVERGSGWKGYEGHSLEIRQQMSEKKNALYATGWEPICGRAKKYDYESPVAGKIKVDGTWELIVAKHLDSLNVKWERNKKRFAYIKPDGVKSTYQPDFYVFDWDTFIEVKGYQTKLDDAKWEQFPHTLLVWKKDKIKELGELST